MRGNEMTEKKHLRSVNKKAIEHNLRHALQKALMDKDAEALHKAADAVVNAGYEMEDLKLLPGMFSVICSALIETGWLPKYDFSNEDPAP
jgi:uncharacterized protein YbjQ (UPF0145 family)